MFVVSILTLLFILFLTFHCYFQPSYIGTTPYQPHSTRVDVTTGTRPKPCEHASLRKRRIKVIPLWFPVNWLVNMATPSAPYGPLLTLQLLVQYTYGTEIASPPCQQMAWHLKGARSSADTVLATNTHTFSIKYLCISVIWNPRFSPYGIIQYGGQSRSTSSVKAGQLGLW